MRVVLLALAWCLLNVGWSQPVVLVAQRIAPVDGERIASDLATLVAEEMKLNFNVKTVVWTMADEAFRAAAYDKIVPGGVMEPNDRQLAEGARALRAQYVVLIRHSGRPDLSGSLLQFGSPGRLNFRVGVEGAMLLESTGGRLAAEHAVARTWALELLKTDLRAHVRRPDSPSASRSLPGEAVVPAPEVAPSVNSMDAVLAQVAQLSTPEQEPELLAFLYAQVDEQPASVAMRTLLIERLRSARKFAQAAEEAERALWIAPGNQGLRLVLVRCLMQLGRIDESTEVLNEARTVDPEGLGVLELAGHLALIRGDAPAAREAYLRVMARQPSGIVHAALTVAVALQGDTAELRRLAAEQPALPTDASQEAYARLEQATDRAVDRVAAELREILRLSRIRPREAPTLERSLRAQKSAEGMSILLQLTVPPERQRTSHRQRVLAQKLLLQAAAESARFARSGDVDAGDEATLSLNEAMKAFADARRTAAAE